MSGHILCAVDESPEGRRACAVAAGLSADVGWDTALLHVVPEHLQLPDPDGMLTERNGQALQAHADRLLASVAEDYGLKPLACQVAVGSPAEEILRAAADQEPELVVVGSRGRGELRSAVLGSVSMSVAQHAACPVVVVPPGVDDAMHRVSTGSAVVCGVEDGERDVKALMIAAMLAERLQGTLHAIHAYSEHPIAPGVPFAPGLAPAAVPPEVAASPPESELKSHGVELLGDAMARAGVVGERRVMHGDPTEVLDHAAKEADARLIVVGTHGQGNIAAAFLGSVSRRLASRAHTPVLVVPPRAPSAA